MPSNLASSFKNPCLPPTLPCFFQVMKVSTISFKTSSPSPITKKSKKSATGSTLYTQGPPPTKNQSLSVRSLSQRGILNKTNIYKTII